MIDKIRLLEVRIELQTKRENEKIQGQDKYSFPIIEIKLKIESFWQRNK